MSRLLSNLLPLLELAAFDYIAYFTTIGTGCFTWTSYVVFFTRMNYRVWLH